MDDKPEQTQTQISRQRGIQQENLSRLTSICSTLKERLYPASTPLEVDDKEKAIEENLVPIAEELRENNRLIKFVADELDGMVHRLEL